MITIHLCIFPITFDLSVSIFSFNKKSILHKSIIQVYFLHLYQIINKLLYMCAFLGTCLRYSLCCINWTQVLSCMGHLVYHNFFILHSWNSIGGVIYNFLPVLYLQEFHNLTWFHSFNRFNNISSNGQWKYLPISSNLFISI